MPLLWLALLTVALVGCKKSTPEEQFIPEVLVTTVQAQDVPIYSEWIGTTEGSINAEIRARVSGYLQKRTYTEGSAVKKGDLLFQIDPRTYQAALDEAKGLLAQAEAKLGKFRQDRDRYQSLLKDGAVSQQEFETVKYSFEAASADVESRKAAVENAQLNLDGTEIHSPIDGVAGFSVAQIGNLINPETLLTTVSKTDPTKVQFAASEQEYLKYARNMNEAMKATREGRKSEAFLELVLADGSVYPEKGYLGLANREVDPKTGSILVQALFPNPDHVLRPGLYAKVRAAVKDLKGGILIPQRAVQELQGMYQVAVVKPDQTIEIRAIQTGERVGSKWVVTQGLAAGETIVVEGIQKVAPGMKVNPQPAPEEPNPSPAPAKS
jgi:membrane fusion protein (multidrug efflux system)